MERATDKANNEMIEAYAKEISKLESEKRVLKNANSKQKKHIKALEKEIAKLNIKIFGM
jgi:phage shock protein A